MYLMLLLLFTLLLLIYLFFPVILFIVFLCIFAILVPIRMSYIALLCFTYVHNSVTLFFY